MHFNTQNTVKKELIIQSSNIIQITHFTYKMRSIALSSLWEKCIETIYWYLVFIGTDISLSSAPSG